MARGGRPIEQATGAFSVTVSDTVNLVSDAGNNYSDEAYTFYTESGGDVKVTTVNGDDIIIPGLPAGSFVPILVKRIWSTGTTTTTGLVALKGI